MCDDAPNEVLSTDIMQVGVIIYSAPLVPMHESWIDLAFNLTGRGRLLRIRPIFDDQVALEHLLWRALF